MLTVVSIVKADSIPRRVYSKGITGHTWRKSDSKHSKVRRNGNIILRSLLNVLYLLRQPKALCQFSLLSRNTSKRAGLCLEYFGKSIELLNFRADVQDVVGDWNCVNINDEISIADSQINEK